MSSISRGRVKGHHPAWMIGRMIGRVMSVNDVQDGGESGPGRLEAMTEIFTGIAKTIIMLPRSINPRNKPAGGQGDKIVKT